MRVRSWDAGAKSNRNRYTVVLNKDTKQYLAMLSIDIGDGYRKQTGSVPRVPFWGRQFLWE